MAGKSIDHPYWRGAAGFAIFTGLAMLVVWAWLYFSGRYVEIEATPVTATVHLLVEVATAIFLIVVGFALINRKSWAPTAYLLAIGALLITVIHAIAYYGERGDIPLVLFFIALAVAGVFFAMRAEE